MPPQTQKIQHTFLKLLGGSDLSSRRLPLMTARTARPGPTLWLTACGHGDEVGGIVIVQEIFRRLRKNPLLRGVLCAFPLMNPIGFETISRQITLSKEDLNRSFPGDPAGSLGRRIAHRIFQYIRRTQPDLVLDLHNDWMHSIPYALLDTPPAGESRDGPWRKAADIARHTGFPVIIDPEVLHGTLSQSLLLQGVASLTLEIGGPYVISEENTDLGVRAIWQVMDRLGMVEPVEAPFEYPLPAFCRERNLRYHDRPYSSTSGIIRFLPRAGDIVEPRQPLARVYNAFGRLQETIRAAQTGIVLGHSDSSVTFPGLPVMAFGVAEG
ncbi:succinylglutamate desuccinylase/aspartoacylase family protein [bacterium]|nr:succinylglutamate desuccinylase/aspartoacylase family protein [bacterium]